jgi:hypothetical protein
MFRDIHLQLEMRYVVRPTGFIGTRCREKQPLSYPKRFV